VNICGEGNNIEWCSRRIEIPKLIGAGQGLKGGQSFFWQREYLKASGMVGVICWKILKIGIGIE
jgi:hypothetical protein